MAVIHSSLDVAFDALTDAALKIKADRDLLLAALNDALEFIADQSDVRDGADGQPRPNRAMSLSQELERVIAQVEA